MEDSIELTEFLEHLNYCLSLKFKEKWRHRFSTHFIEIFQEKVLKSLDTQRPLKKSSLITTYTRKYKYSVSEVENFFRLINVEDYYPIVYEDKKYLEMRKLFSVSSINY
tara:strand:- start:214 stop:540 length:327 start_codon:yes stop_codon:yes gene_type:complete